MWDADRVRLLRRWWVDENLSAGEIAHRVKATRNAVMGAIHRYLPANVRGQHIGGPGLKRAAPRPPRRARRARPAPRVTVVAELAIPPRPPRAPPPNGVGLLALGANDCRWPIRGTGLLAVFCGGEVSRRSYCAAHAARASVPIPSKPSRKASP